MKSGKIFSLTLLPLLGALIAPQVVGMGEHPPAYNPEAYPENVQRMEGHNLPQPSAPPSVQRPERDIYQPLNNSDQQPGMPPYSEEDIKLMAHAPWQSTAHNLNAQLFNPSALLPSGGNNAPPAPGEIWEGIRVLPGYEEHNGGPLDTGAQVTKTESRQEIDLSLEGIAHAIRTGEERMVIKTTRKTAQAGTGKPGYYRKNGNGTKDPRTRIPNGPESFCAETNQGALNFYKKIPQAKVSYNDTLGMRACGYTLASLVSGIGFGLSGIYCGIIKMCGDRNRQSELAPLLACAAAGVATLVTGLLALDRWAAFWQWRFSNLFLSSEGANQLRDKIREKNEYRGQEAGAMFMLEHSLDADQARDLFPLRFPNQATALAAKQSIINSNYKGHIQFYNHKKYAVEVAPCIPYYKLEKTTHQHRLWRRF